MRLLHRNIEVTVNKPEELGDELIGAIADIFGMVCYQLQAKLKIPRPVSKQQDEQAVNLFKKTFPTPLLAFKTF